MDGDKDRIPAAVLVSGGVDSAVLVADLCQRHSAVFPVFLRGGLVWEQAELEHLQDFLRAIARPELRPLTLLEQPVRDVYGDHWATTGQGVPNGGSPDEAVYLPGRNLFLITKAAVWCVLNQVGVLALGSLKANPFPDSTPEFDRELESLVQRAMSPGARALRIVRPFAKLTKAEVLRCGAHLPLERTFSCINPVPARREHCGLCNKCAERRLAFREAGLADRTVYANAIR